MAAKVSKLEEQFQKDAPREQKKDGKSSYIFSGVAIYVNGYTGQTLPASPLQCAVKTNVKINFLTQMKSLLLHCACSASP